MRKKVSKNNQNLKQGDFTQNELELYGIKEKYIKSVLTYQEKLHILIDDEINYVNGRELYAFAGYSDDQFTKWIQRKLERVMAEENEDYRVSTKSGKNSAGGRPNTDYYLSLDCAKDIMMTEKGELGKITRDYFKAMETVAKARHNWNKDRENTLIKCKELKHALIIYKNNLLKTYPSWCSNQFQAEFCLLNEVIIGMSASQYRKVNSLKPNAPIRNTFTEQQLEYVDELERFDADILMVQNVFGYEDRKTALKKKFSLMNKRAS